MRKGNHSCGHGQQGAFEGWEMIGTPSLHELRDTRGFCQQSAMLIAIMHPEDWFLFWSDNSHGSIIGYGIPHMRKEDLYNQADPKSAKI
jgi:hypothetical protein